MGNFGYEVFVFDCIGRSEVIRVRKKRPLLNKYSPLGIILSFFLFNYLNNKSLSLSILVHHISAEPDLTQPMYLLNRIKFNHPHIYHLSLVEMLIVSVSGRDDPSTHSRCSTLCPGQTLRVDQTGVLTLLWFNGLLRSGMVLESLKVVRAMVVANLAVGPELRRCVYRAFLREARVKEAVELDEALGFVGPLDLIIANWVD